MVDVNSVTALVEQIAEYERTCPNERHLAAAKGLPRTDDVCPDCHETNRVAVVPELRETCYCIGSFQRGFHGICHECESTDEHGNHCLMCQGRNWKRVGRWESVHQEWDGQDADTYAVVTDLGLVLSAALAAGFRLTVHDQDMWQGPGEYKRYRGWGCTSPNGVSQLIPIEVTANLNDELAALTALDISAMSLAT